MSLVIPESVQQVFDRFITTEYVTVDAKGQPIAWPVTPYYQPGQATIDITTGIGYPKKADDAARHPKIAMLFSDPTGSKLENPPQVLVQGTAYVDDADLDANRRRYRREAVEKLPGTKDMMPPKFVEGLFSWYYERIYVKLTPERVTVWPGGDAAVEPEVYGELLPAAGAPAAGAASTTDPVWDSRMDELSGRYDSAVLAWLGPDGYPFAVRLPVSAEAAGKRIRFSATPVGVPRPAGLACVTAHSHHPDFKWQENFQVRGDLEPGGDAGPVVVPRKMVGGFELPDESQFAVMKRNFKKARRYHRIAKERRAARAAG